MAKKKALSKSFVRISIVLSTLLMTVLVLVGLVYWKRRPAILAERAEAALQGSDYEKAVALLEQMDQTEQTETQLLAARYGAAEKLLAEGDYTAAETAFSALGDYGDAREKILACRYGLAEQAYSAGAYEEAKERFYALSGYSDALQRYNDSRYAIALQTEETDRETAFALFYELGGFSDAKQQAERIAIAITGMPDPENAVNYMLGVSEEEILARDRLKTIRTALPQSVLAVGFYHTVGLKADGTVIAAGRNQEGQCAVESWKNVTAIDCGAYHTVGLLSDGTVVAVGRNSEAQCNVQSWTGIVAIACTDYDTIGLRSDGTVVHTGYHAYPELAGWTNVVSIGGGSYAAVALTESGQALSSHSSSRSEALSGALVLDASTGYAAALLETGAVVLSGEQQPKWTDAVAISAGSTGILGIDADQKVLTHWFRMRDALDFTDIHDAVAVAAGGTHSAVLKADGLVIARGSNEYGECDTAAWKLASTSLPSV